MTNNDIKALLLCPLFSSLTTDEAKELTSSHPPREVKCARGGTLIEKGGRPSGIYIILRGTAGVKAEDSPGSPYINLFFPGDAVGMSVLYAEGALFPTCIKAKTNCCAVFYSKETLESIFTRFPAVMRAYISLLTNKILWLSGKLSSVLSPSAADALFEFLRNESGGEKTFEPGRSMSDISKLLGIGRTTLYRALDELTAEGRITRQGKKITINYSEDKFL